MRVPKNLWVVFVRLKTGGTEIHASTGDRQVARFHFKDAEKRTDCDQIWLELYLRNPPIESKAEPLAVRVARLKVR